MKNIGRLLFILVGGWILINLTPPSFAQEPLKIVAPDNGYDRPIQAANQWERFGTDLLWNFCNVYQPCVIERPDKEYRYEMWFFGWAAEDTNPGYSGCDAIYFARSKNLRLWEVYCGEQGWDTEMKPQKWVPVLTASDRFYDEWHNGDPSVVFHNGKYYMAYSATSKPNYKKSEQHLQGMLLCIMGATSTDGIHWEKTAQPLLIEPPEVQQAENTDSYPCDFHRPSLMWDENKWKLWFDYWLPGSGVCMGYAENTGTFDQPNGFVIKHSLRTPLIKNWPNPCVIKTGDKYYSFADPSGFPPKDDRTPEAKIWTTRAICEAISNDGLNWKIVGYIEPDKDTPACHVPQALITQSGNDTWLYVFYATQRGGYPLYDYRYDRIRAIRRLVK